MKFLFQHSIISDLEYAKEISYRYSSIEIRLLFFQADIFSKGKKLQLIIDAETKEQAYSILPEYFHSTYDKIIIFTGENVDIFPFPEIILIDETTKAKRTLFFDIVSQQVPFTFNTMNLRRFIDFIQYPFQDDISSSIYFLRRAHEAVHPEDKYFNTFRALESLCKKTKENRKCHIHNSELICPQGNHAVEFEHLTKKIIDDVLLKIDQDKYFNLNSDILLKYRHQCAHRTKKISKKAASITELQDAAQNLYSCISHYIVDKYFWMNGKPDMPFLAPMIKYGRHTAMIETYFTTKNIDKDFALDVPSINLLRTKMEAGWNPKDGYKIP